MTAKDNGHETVDEPTRDQMLEDADFQCQLCARNGVEHGGAAQLEIHHIDRNPDQMDEHDPQNLLVLCRHCHAWHHQQPDPEKAPVELTEADLEEMRPKDTEILAILAEQGPLKAGEVAEAHTADLTVMTARERLWALMGLDNKVPQRDHQLIDQDVTTGEWGLAEQVTNSKRGRIPDDTRTLLQRAADERVRQAIARGCDRDVVADVMNVHPRTTWNQEKRAQAYEFPLDAIDGRTGGRSSGDDATADDDSEAHSGDRDGLAQQRLDATEHATPDAVTADGGDNKTDSAGDDDAAAVMPESGGADAEDQSESIEMAVQRAIEALREVQREM